MRWTFKYAGNQLPRATAAFRSGRVVRGRGRSWPFSLPEHLPGAGLCSVAPCGLSAGASIRPRAATRRRCCVSRSAGQRPAA
jgi:hypothetical protein